MYSRVTLLEIDTLRVDMAEAVALFENRVLPSLQAQEGYVGVFVLTTPEGKGLIMSLWETEEAADAASAFASGELERHMVLFRAPPGREHYEGAVADLPVLAG
jgi:hypothetical protein